MSDGPELPGKTATSKRSPYLVSEFKTREWGADGMRIGDLNGDGAPELIIPQVKNLAKPGTTELLCRTHEISCITAVTITGKILWQWGEPDILSGCCMAGAPIEIYDWDNDGENEVLFIEHAIYAEMYPEDPPELPIRAKRYEGTATLVVLDAKTGRKKTSLPIPAPADYQFSFADLTGRGRREDFVLKDGYGENVFGVTREGEWLWHWHGGPWPVPSFDYANKPKVFNHDEKCEAGHCPAVGDVDGDGLDEVFFGFSLLDHDGEILFRRDVSEPGEHQDASEVVHTKDGTCYLLYGNGGVHCLRPDGTVLWENQMVFNEAQCVVPGRFRPETELQVAVIDRGAPRTIDGEPACLYLFDLETGKEFWRRKQLPGGWCAGCQDIRWNGGEFMDILVSGRGVLDRGRDSLLAIYDGQGEIMDEFTVPASLLDNDENVSPYPGACSAYRSDVWGDSREEVIVMGRNGVRTYANGRPLALPPTCNGRGLKWV